jgi:MFS family permease
MKIKIIIILFLIGLFLIEIVHSNIITDSDRFIEKIMGISDIRQTIRPDYSWINISFLAILVMLFIGAIGYMFSGIFGERIKAYSKRLIGDALLNAIIILIISGIFLFYNSTTLTNTYITQMLHLEGSINYIKTIRNSLLVDFAWMSIITALVSYIGNMAPYFRPAGIIGVSFSIAPAFRPFFDITGVLLSAIASANGVWYAQLWFLNFVQNKMFALFVPIGLFLRATKFEGIGNTLIALCLGFFFVYPLILNLGFVMFERYMQLTHGKDYSVISDDGKRFPTIAECVQYQKEQLKKQKYIECSIDANENFLKSIGNTILDLLKNLLNPLSWLVFLVSRSVFSSLIILLVFQAVLTFLKIVVEYVIVLTLILPALSIFLTFLAVDEIAKFLGTEIDLSAFEKIF